MNKLQLIERVAKTLGTPTAHAKAPVEAVLDVIVRELTAGGSVTLTGLGTFDVQPMAARTARNVLTGDPVAIPARFRPRFRAGRSLLDLVNGRKQLPESGSAVAKAPKGSLSGGAR